MEPKILFDAATVIPPDAPCDGVIRYVSQEASKNLTKAEAIADLKAGKSVTAVYEDGATDYTGGGPLGEAHGLIAKQILDTIGYPNDKVLLVAVDTDIQPQYYYLGLAYVKACAIYSGRQQGVYGPDGFVRYCMANGVAYGMNAAGWEDGQPNNAQIQQTLIAPPPGYDVDVDHALVENWGQWTEVPPEPTPKPTPPPIPVPQEDEVYIVHVADANGNPTAAEYLFGIPAGDASPPWTEPISSPIDSKGMAALGAKPAVENNVAVCFTQAFLDRFAVTEPGEA